MRDLICLGMLALLLACTSPTAHDGTVKLKWTATGDDGHDGVAAEYDLRFSLSPITEANFLDATRTIPPDFPTPGPDGTVERTSIEGLTVGSTYYFAAKVRDSSWNWSAMSNVLEVDGVSPAALVLELDI
ncbi:MAG TPA: hypothetical protein VFI02_14230 [Armatimonadota bacterium]|nr:hypothetical protein [Armatimonadota bacterium]